jgi:hypothetical protein
MNVVLREEISRMIKPSPLERYNGYIAAFFIFAILQFVLLGLVHLSVKNNTYKINKILLIEETVHDLNKSN